MGKMFNTLVLSGFISIMLFLFDGSGVLSVIAQFFLSPPTDWGDFLSNALTSALGVSTIAGVSSIIIGSVFVKQDWLVRVGMFTVLISWVSAPFIRLWMLIGSKLSPEVCTNAYNCLAIQDGVTVTTLGMVVASLLVGPLVLYAFWACWTQIWSPESSG